MKHSSKEVPIKQMAVLLIIATISGGVQGCSPAPPTPICPPSPSTFSCPTCPPTPTCPSCPTTTKCPPTPTTVPCPTCASTSPCPPPPTCPSTSPCPPPPTCPTCPTKTTPSIPTCPTKSCPPIPTCPTIAVGGTWELGGNINPCDGGNFGYVGPWSKGVNVGSSVQAFTKDFIDIDIWKKRAGFVTIARHVNGQCTMSKTWELKDKTRSLYSYFSTYPGRIYATGDGSRSDNHIVSDIPQSAEGLNGTWRDPIFGAEGGLVFNWCHSDNGVRIAVPGGYVKPYNLPGIDDGAENMSGLGNDYHANTKNGTSTALHTEYWYDVGKIGTNCGWTSCQFVGTDQGSPLQSNPGDKACWGSYAIFVSQDAMSFNCQGRALTTVEKV